MTARAWTAAAAVLLVLLSLGPIHQGMRLLRRPHQIRAQVHVRQVPATGPYTPSELDSAAMDWRQFSGVMRHDIPADELAPLAESRRRQEDLIESGRKRRSEALADDAESRRPFGWLLIALGAVLMLVFAALGINAIRAPASPPAEMPSGEE